MSGRASIRIGTCLLALVVVAGCVAFLTRDAGASPFSLFVRRTTVESTLEGGKVYAPVSNLLKAMGFQWTATGEGYDVKTGPEGGPEIKSRRFVVSYQGKTFSPDTMYAKGRIWVLVKPFVKELGALYLETPGTGMAQVSFPQGQITDRDIARAVKEAQRRPTVASKPPSTGDGKAPGGDKPAASPSPDKPGDSASKDEEKEPLEPKVSYTNPAIPASKVPAQVVGTVTIKNTSDQPVKNVRYTLVFNDQSGQPVQTMPIEFVSEIAAGQSIQKDFMWWNYAQVMNLDPKVKIEHDPLPKKKKDDGGKPDAGKTTPAPAPSPGPGKK